MPAAEPEQQPAAESEQQQPVRTFSWCFNALIQHVFHGTAPPVHVDPRFGGELPPQWQGWCDEFGGVWHTVGVTVANVQDGYVGPAVQERLIYMVGTPHEMLCAWAGERDAAARRLNRR